MLSILPTRNRNKGLSTSLRNAAKCIWYQQWYQQEGEKKKHRNKLQKFDCGSRRLILLSIVIRNIKDVDWSLTMKAISRLCRLIREATKARYQVTGHPEKGTVYSLFSGRQSGSRLKGSLTGYLELKYIFHTRGNSQYGSFRKRDQ